MRPLTSIGRDPRTDWKTSRLYKLAKRTLVASVVCLSISFCNVLYVVISNGHQRGLVCLTMCTVDVTVSLFFSFLYISIYVYIYKSSFYYF